MSVEYGNERISANGGGRSEGLRPGAAGYFRGGAPKRKAEGCLQPDLPPLLKETGSRKRLPNRFF